MVFYDNDVLFIILLFNNVYNKPKFIPRHTTIMSADY